MHFSDYQKSSAVIIRELQVVHGIQTQASRDIVSKLGSVVSLFISSTAYLNPSYSNTACFALAGSLFVGALGLPPLLKRFESGNDLDKCMPPPPIVINIPSMLTIFLVFYYRCYCIAGFPEGFADGPVCTWDPFL